MIHFTRWIGLGAVLAVLGLVGNALLLAARGRVQESAILQTIGFQRFSIGLVLLGEGALLGLAGGAAGSLAAALFFNLKRYTVGNEGLTLALTSSWSVTLSGLLIAVLLGLIASIWPALLASSRPLVRSLR